MKQLITFLILLAFVSLHSCKKESEPDNINPVSSGIANPNRFVNYYLTNPKNKAGLIIADSLEKEMHIVYGRKDTDGNLKTVTSIDTYLDEQNIFYSVNVNSEHLITEIKAIAKYGNRTLRLTDYDLSKKTVKLQLFDTFSNTPLGAIETVPIDQSVFNSIGTLKTLGPNLRIAATTANNCEVIVDYVRTMVKMTQCVLSWKYLAAFTYCTLIAVSNLPISDAALRCQEGAAEVLYEKCGGAGDAIEKLIRYRCIDEPDPKEILDPLLECLTRSAVTSKNSDDFKNSSEKCIDDLWDKIKEKLPFDLDNSGGSWGDPHLLTRE